MHRRLLIAPLGCWPMVRVPAQEAAAEPKPHQKVSANALRQALMARFPVDFGLPGLFDVRVNARGLLLLPRRQRLGASLHARVTDLSTGSVYPCDLDLTFAVRYEASDQTLRAHDLQVLGLRSPALPADTAQALQALLDEAARNAMAEVVLHRFSRAELALPDSLGFQPGRITVERDGLEIGFEPRAATD